MSKKQKGGSQTEPPTQKRLRDARKEGDVHKSRELTSTVVVLLWLLMGWLLGPPLYQHLVELFTLSLDSMQRPLAAVLPELATTALRTLAWAILVFLLPAIVLGLAVEYLQAGPVFAPQRAKPKAEHLNPVEGMKRMFSQKNLVEVVKAVFKTGMLVGIFIFVLFRLLPDYLILPMAQPGMLFTAFWKGTVLIGIGVIFVFFFIAVLDAIYQRLAFIKDMKMSRRDIRQEVKSNEGDPQIKSRRKQLHQEWAQQNMLQAVRQATAVVTNPTHIAVALTYDPEETDLPVVSAKGEGHLAELIRRTADEAGVPVMQNVPLARGLYERIAVDNYITPEFFDAAAEVLSWAASASHRER